MQAIKDFIFDNKQDPSQVGAMLDRKVTKKTIVALGTMRAGKTTHFAGLGSTAQFKVNDSIRTGNLFRFIPHEEKTNLLDDIAELKCGHFPEATKVTTSQDVRPAYTFEWEDTSLLGNVIRRADMPIIDFAGEQLVGLMAQVKAARTFEQASAIQGTDQLTSTVNQCSALLPIIKAERAEGLPCFKPEPQIAGMSKHPDVNLQRMLLPIIEYKRNNRRYSPPLERIGIVITACDVLWPYAKTISAMTGRPFDPLNPDISQTSLESFMKAFFTGTYSLINSLNIQVTYFPSYFELEKDAQGNTQYWDDEKTQPKIKRGNIFDSPNWEDNVNRPKFTEYWFNREIEWLKEFATKV